MGQLRNNGIDKKDFRIKIENKRLSDTLLFFKGQPKKMLKCVLHVQHAYFSSFIQSNHCFLELRYPELSSLVNSLQPARFATQHARHALRANFTFPRVSRAPPHTDPRQHPVEQAKLTDTSISNFLFFFGLFNAKSSTFSMTFVLFIFFTDRLSRKVAKKW